MSSRGWKIDQRMKGMKQIKEELQLLAMKSSQLWLWEWVDIAAINQDGEDCGRARCGKYYQFYFRHISFEISTKNPRNDASLGFREKL